MKINVKLEKSDFTVKILVISFLMISSFIIVMGSPLNPWSKGQVGPDSSVFKYMALVMSKGGMPYKNAFDHKGPLLYLINYVGNLISYYSGIWIIELVFIFVFLIYAYKIARLLCSPLVSCFFVAMAVAPVNEYFDGGNLTEEYAMLFLTVGIFIFIDYFLNDRVTKTRLIVCGVCFGAIIMLRVNMISVWLVFCIAVLIKNWKKDRKIIWRFLGWFLIGAAIIVIPFMLWLIKGGAFFDFIRDYLIFNMKYTSNEERAHMLNKYSSVMRWLNMNLPLIEMVILVYLIKKKENVFLNTAYLIYVFATIALTAMSGMIFGHYGMGLLPVYIYPLCGLAHYINEYKKDDTVLVLFCAILLLYNFPSWKNNLDNTMSILYDPNKDTPIEDDMDTLLYMIDRYTTEEDKIQVIGNYNYIYVKSRRVAASKYSYQFPLIIIDKNIKEEFCADMENEMPPIIIVEDIENDSYMELFTTIDEYQLVFVTDDKEGIYKRLS